MRLIAFLLVPSLTLAAPAIKRPVPPNLQVKLAAETASVLEVTIQNTGKEPLAIPYRVTLLEHLVVDLRGEKGKSHRVDDLADNRPEAKPGTLVIPAGESRTFSLHTCHYLPLFAEPGERITFAVRLKYDGQVIESKPLTVGR